MWSLEIGRRSLRAVAKNRTAHAAKWISSSTQPAKRQLLSDIWIPTAGKSASKDESAHDMLVRAGFLRQSQSGVFHLLPLGLLVQAKIGELIDKHMESLGASRLSMSTLTTEELWRKSGRFENVSSELFRLKDRKDIPLMLAPTHEEEVTTLVAETVKSYKELPIKLYQNTRKYRDEIRPRHGLLRGREFVMVDLYSFDLTFEESFETYKKVTEAYRAIFKELGLEVTMAEASSGDMGGDLSHEWHAALPNGSDTIFACKRTIHGAVHTGCGYAANDEVATTRPRPPVTMEGWSQADTIEWRGITKDKKTLVRAWLYKSSPRMTAQEVSIHAVKALIPDLDASVSGLAWHPEDGLASKASHLVDIIDSRLSAQHEAKRLPSEVYSPTIGTKELSSSTLDLSRHENAPDLVKISAGDPCPRCDDGELYSERSMEMGHTFYLGTRYTEPLSAKVTFADNKTAPLHMGCYGIGVSRLLGTIAEIRARQDGQEWSWPVAIAPFHVIIVPVGEVTQDVLDFYDTIRRGKRFGPNVVLDDRQRSFGWKMKDAQMFGIPINIVLGKGWKDRGEVEWRGEGSGGHRHVRVDDAADLVEERLFDREQSFVY